MIYVSLTTIPQRIKNLNESTYGKIYFTVYKMWIDNIVTGIGFGSGSLPN